MENRISGGRGMDFLTGQVVELINTAQSLAALFEEEVTQIKCLESVSRLKKLHMEILNELNWTLRSEIAIGGSYDSVSTIGSILQFGTVLVCIGPDGVPDDIRVVNISQIVRETRRDEKAVISSLEIEGDVLMRSDVFSSLMDTLIDRIITRKLILPISQAIFKQITPRIS
jgi:hypothetical protein